MMMGYGQTGRVSITASDFGIFLLSLPRVLVGVVPPARLMGTSKSTSRGSRRRCMELLLAVIDGPLRFGSVYLSVICC
jgi:hypothetical protein